jgi:RecA-family ATPase
MKVIQIKNPNQNQKPKIITFETIEPRKTDWLWDKYFAVGSLNAIQGVQGDGKTFFALALASAVSNGGLKNHPILGTIGGGKVLYQTAEDSLEQTIVPRLINMGANLSNIFCIDKGDLDLNTRSSELEKAIDIIRPQLVILDTIAAYIGDTTNMNQQNQVRGALKPLINIAEKYNVCIVFVAHTSKAGYGRGVQRMIGSIDFSAACRSVMEVSIDKDSGVTNVLNVKNNLYKKQIGVGYQIEENKLIWKAPSKTEEQVDNQFSNSGNENKVTTKQEEAEEAILEVLRGAGTDADGEYCLVASTKLEKEICENYKFDTFRRARNKLKKEKIIKPVKKGIWCWKLEV